VTRHGPAVRKEFFAGWTHCFIDAAPNNGRIRLDRDGLVLTPAVGGSARREAVPRYGCTCVVAGWYPSRPTSACIRPAEHAERTIEVTDRDAHFRRRPLAEFDKGDGPLEVLSVAHRATEGVQGPHVDNGELDAHGGDCR